MTLPEPMEEPLYSVEGKGVNSVLVVTLPAHDPLPLPARLLKEAEKSSLMAAAYIQHLAARAATSPATHIQLLYLGYRDYLKTHRQEKYLRQCAEILSAESAIPFVKQMATYVQAILNGREVVPSQGQTFIDNLLPYFKESLQSQAPQYIYTPQEVYVPEMGAQYAAFPDLIKHEGHYYAAFRLANTHVAHGDFGQICLLRGSYQPETHQWQWHSVACLSHSNYDLRDPKFFVDSNNNLKMMVGASIIDKQDTTMKMVPHIAYSLDGQWQLQPAELDFAPKIKGEWLWRLTWNLNDNQGYGFAYNCDSEEESQTLSLLVTKDALHFEKVSDITVPGLNEPLSEATIRFRKDGTAVALIRSRRHGVIGIATKESAYKKWTFNIVPFRIGGHDFALTGDEKQGFAALRYIFVNQNGSLDDATMLAYLDETKLVPLQTLHSDTDASYPGIVQEDDGSLTIIYYSTLPYQQSLSKIYITRIKPGNTK